MIKPLSNPTFVTLSLSLSFLGQWIRKPSLKQRPGLSGSSCTASKPNQSQLNWSSPSNRLCSSSATTHMAWPCWSASQRSTSTWTLISFFNINSETFRYSKHKTDHSSSFLCLFSCSSLLFFFFWIIIYTLIYSE